MTRLLRLRPDLVIVPQESHFVVKDPVRNTFVRLGAAEMLVARHFDGASTLEEIRGRLETEHGVVAPIENLERFRDRLHGLQLIVAPGEEVAGPEEDLGISGGPLRKLFYVRLPFEVDPDRFLTGLLRGTRFLFSRAFVLAAAVPILVAAGVWVLELGEVLDGIETLASPAGVGLLVPALVVSVSIHELMHGLAVKAHGGSVRRMGAILHYLLPRFYTDVSDAWLFPDRRSRAGVIIAGPFATIVLWALATLAWWGSPPGGLAARGAVAFMVVNLIGAVRTLIPFLSGDGYLLLSNAVDTPNLRRRSIDHVTGWVKRALGRSTEPAPVVPARLRRLYVTYAIGAAVSSVLLAAGGVLVLGWLLGTLTGAAGP